MFYFPSALEDSLCIVEPEAAPNAIPNVIPSPMLSITDPRIIPKTTPNDTPIAILFSSSDSFKFYSFIF